jgi:tetratricopeptide (TPR) repeat protein
MSSKSKIRIVSRHSSEIYSRVTIEDLSYDAYTEYRGGKSKEIISNIYLKGKIIHSNNYDYSHYPDQKHFKDKLDKLMEEQHKSTIQNFVLKKTRQKKHKSDYFEEIQELLKKSAGKSALERVRKALNDFPLDPFFLSYYGCLIALLENNPKEGIKICRNAIIRLKEVVPFGSELYYPVFYLNLGRAYASGNRKKEAISAFKRGLKNDPSNEEILSELKKLGVRKKPVVQFLDRSSPINKYIGLLVAGASRRK